MISLDKGLSNFVFNHYKEVTDIDDVESFLIGKEVGFTANTSGNNAAYWMFLGDGYVVSIKPEYYAYTATSYTSGDFEDGTGTITSVSNTLRHDGYVVETVIKTTEDDIEIEWVKNEWADDFCNSEEIFITLYKLKE